MEAYLSSYSSSPRKGTRVLSILGCFKGRTGMCFDDVREGSGLWFSTVEESRA